MKRILSVWLKRWPVDRLRRYARRRRGPADRLLKALEAGPFALTHSGAHGIRLVALNEVAEAGGLRAGMMLADARAVLPALKVRPHVPLADEKALKRLALWAGRYSPWVNLDGTDGLKLDISGCAHLFGGEEAMLADLAARLARMGLSARLGLADTHAAAWAAARFGGEGVTLIPPGAGPNALYDFPVEALGLDADSLLLLRRLGLKRIGDAARVPRIALARRFRNAERSLALVNRLDALLGEAAEPLDPLQPAPVLRARRAFAEPLANPTALPAIVAELAGDLMAVLAREGKGARRLLLELFAVDGAVHRFPLGLSRPTRGAKHITYLFKEHVEHIDLQYGIDTAILNVTRAERLTDEQTDLARKGDLSGGTEAAPALVDRLANRLGAPAVMRLAQGDSHIPERQQKIRVALTGKARDKAGKEPDWTARPVDALPRPLRLFARPEPIEVMAEIPEGPPSLFRWRRMTVKVARAEGPERIAPEWWRAPNNGEDGGNGGESARVRDYYRIEDGAGHRFWVYRDGLYRELAGTGLPRWYMHGLYG